MARAKLSGPNMAIGATFEGGTWSEALPLENLLDTRLVTHPARCRGTTPETGARLICHLSRKRPIKGVLLEACTLESDATYRITLSDRADLSEAYLVTDWLPWNDRVTASANLAWEDENFWSGVASDQLLAVYGRRVLWLPETGVSAQHIGLEFDAPTQAGFDLGYLHVFDTISPSVNFSYGAKRTFGSRSLVDETLSGHEVVQRRAAGRGHEVTFDSLTQAEANDLFDLVHRVDQDQPVVFVPDAADTLDLFRDVYLGKLEMSSTSHDTFQRHSASLTIRRIVA